MAEAASEEEAAITGGTREEIPAVSEVVSEEDHPDPHQEETVEAEDGIQGAEKADSPILAEEAVASEAKAEASDSIAIDRLTTLEAVADSAIKTEMEKKSQLAQTPSDMRTGASRAAAEDSLEVTAATARTEEDLQDLRAREDRALVNHQDSKHKAVHREITRKEKAGLSTKDLGNYSWEDGLHSSNFEGRFVE